LVDEDVEDALSEYVELVWGVISWDEDGLSSAQSIFSESTFS